MIFTLFVFLRTKGPQIAYERSFRWKLAHFRYLCQVCVLLLLGVILSVSVSWTHLCCSRQPPSGCFSLVVLLSSNSSFLLYKSLRSLCFLLLELFSARVNCVTVTGQAIMFHVPCVPQSNALPSHVKITVSRQTLFEDSFQQVRSLLAADFTTFMFSM